MGSRPLWLVLTVSGIARWRRDSVTAFWSIRAPHADDAAALADLKIEWSQPDAEPTDAECAAFAEHLIHWMSARSESLLCRVAVSDGRLIGMAWMVLYERVPNFDQQRRLSADLQSVYVIPAMRRRGIGAALDAELCAEVDSLGIPRTTVHSSSRAAELYRRAGFARDEMMLSRVRPD